jgi:hypothetical protein
VGSIIPPPGQLVAFLSEIPPYGASFDMMIVPVAGEHAAHTLADRDLGVRNLGGTVPRN